MIGARGDGWALAMTVVSHEREPGELGYVARYRKLAKELTAIVKCYSEVKDYREKRRIAIFVITVISMLLTPAEPYSMVMMMMPLIGVIVSTVCYNRIRCGTSS